MEDKKGGKQEAYKQEALKLRRKLNEAEAMTSAYDIILLSSS